MQNDFDPLIIRGKSLIPVVQGGMGVGVSASKLSSAVARENGVGTIASVDLRHLHEDLLAESKIDSSEEKYTRLNCIALDREIKKAKADSEGKGMIAVNVMKAVKDHAAYVRQACESGADAVVMGAGLPLDLPEMTEGYHKDVALFPILSESRGINIVLKRWMKKGILPDAIVIEHPAHAAGHLGAATVDGVNDAKFEFKRVIEETFEVFKNLGLESEKIPLVLAGGMANFEKVKTALKNWGASAVQIGTTSAKEVKKNPDIQVKELNSSADTFLELKAGGVQAVVNDRPVNDYYIAKSGEKDVRVVNELLTSEDYGIAMAKDNQELQKKVDDALKKLKENGKYDEIYKKWFGQKAE